MPGYDDSGRTTLEAIAGADRFNEWMYDTVKPFCHGKILEIGSGIGNISRFFVRDRWDVSLSDSSATYLETLRAKFPSTDVFDIDIAATDFDSRVKHLAGKFDTVFLLNVLEHIEDDGKALLHCGSLLNPGGTLVVLVPAYRALYARLDKELGHFRRYTKRSLGAVIENAGMEPKRVFYFNAIGISAWLYAKCFRLKRVPKKEMNIFDRLSGPGKVIDRLVMHSIGLSAIGVATKN